MEQLINFQSAAIQAVLPRLLEDKSTGRNIIWATEPPEVLQPDVSDKSEMTVAQLQQMGFDLLLPRTHKQSAAQQARTRKRGEVNTPAWLCCKMNDFLDADWFGPERGSPFTVELPQGWQTVPEPVQFAPGRHKNSIPGWQKYVDSRRLEITCGEAPFLASRYDAATGEPIPVGQRIGILDRKLRIVGENTATEADWLEWAFRALQSVYGYEYQGDSLLLARVNLILTFAEHLEVCWQRQPTPKEMETVAEILVWNVFQMDGLNLTVPGGTRFQRTEQLSFFAPMNEEPERPPAVPCKVKKWYRDGKNIRGVSQDFETIQEGSTSMKFDYVIGNPPYQDEMEGTSDNPVYNLFMDATYPMASVVELITPARFLFNAGKTPKAWNEEMLNDEHLKVLYYEQNSAKIFTNTDIKGGVVITCHDKTKNSGAIQIFTTYPLLNTIIQKVRKRTGKVLSDIVFAPESYKFTKQMYSDHPEILTMTTISKGKEVSLISKGHDYDLTSNIFDKLFNIVFFEKQSFDECIKIFGRKSNERVCLYIDRRYVAKHPNLDKYKLFFPKANGSGKFGEVMTDSDIGEKGVGHTQTFISIGAFDTRLEAVNLQKYLKCKFARALLYVLKVTQDNKKSVWKYVPLQNFTSNSDIDWSKPVADIDRQLYKKYDLSADEIDFIETHVKEMA